MTNIIRPSLPSLASPNPCPPPGLLLPSTPHTEAALNPSSLHALLYPSSSLSTYLPKSLEAFLSASPWRHGSFFSGMGK